jgi:hypothetical protein
VAKELILSAEDAENMLFIYKREFVPPADLVQLVKLGITTG